MVKKSTFGEFSAITSDATLHQLQSSSNGLTTSEAQLRLKQYGPNQLSAATRHWYHILLSQFQSPFLYLLTGATVLSAVLGEVTNSILILLFVTINTVLGFYQEYHSEKALQLLKHFVISKCFIWRDGRAISLPSNELVPGDVLELHQGDILTADVRFLSVENLMVNESILTGETASVAKTIEPLPKPAADMYQASNIGFAGTSVISGQAQAVVFATGKQTQIGAITKLTVETHHQSTFERNISKLSSFILKLIVVTLVFITLINIYLKGTSANLGEIIIFAIALAISVVPEALPVVTSFSLARGALKLAKHKVVVKRLSSIEDFGSIEVLCTDKTGTITENQMQVSQIYPAHSEAIKLAALASNVTSYRQTANDSFDRALLEALPYSQHQALSSYQRLESLPFDPVRRCNSLLVREKNTYQVILRGAFEHVLDKCDHLSAETKAQYLEWAKTEGQSGKRVIAVAERTFTQLPTHKLLQIEKSVKLVGLISFLDPLKKTASQSVKEAKNLGVQLKILTGDSPDVAGYIAQQVGLIEGSHQVITGNQLNQLTPEQQRSAVQTHSVFARVSPEQKYQIIQLLQRNYEVGFLGDGINDAPALKAADIGIVVEGASDIAREAADIVLLNQSLHVIVNGIKEGREIFANTAKYIKTTLASNFGNFYTVALAALFIPFLPLLPLQIMLINILTDLPIIAIATDNIETGQLKRPHNYDIKGIALIATVMGLVSSVFDFILFGLFIKSGAGVLQTNLFIFSVWSELIFVFSMRSHKSILKSGLPSWPLINLSLISFAITFGLPFISWSVQFFKFTTPSWTSVAIVLLLTGTYLLANEVVKHFYYQFSLARPETT